MSKRTCSIVAAFLPLLAACAGKPSAVGTWGLDVDAMKKSIESMMQEQIDKAPAAQQAMMKQVMAQMVESMTKSNGSIQLAADGTATMHQDSPDGKHEDTKGTWKLDGDKISLTMVPPGKQTAETKTGTLTGDEIRIDEDAGGRKMTMVFRRKN